MDIDDTHTRCDQLLGDSAPGPDAPSITHSECRDIVPSPHAELPLGYRQTGVRSGNLSQVDASRSRARRVAGARAVVILAAIAGAALLFLIVVGSLTSDTTDEMGRPNRGHIGLTVCQRRTADLRSLRLVGPLARRREYRVLGLGPYVRVESAGVAGYRSELSGAPHRYFRHVANPMR